MIILKIDKIVHVRNTADYYIYVVINSNINNITEYSREILQK